MKRSYSTRAITALVAGLIIVMTLGATPRADAIMLVSRSQEVAIGRQVEQDIVRQFGGLTNDPALARRVANIGADVASASPRQNVQYTYRVLNSNVINAFAAPGGPVLITEGLARMLNDQELAFVLAHETGHIAGEHGRDAINRSLIASGLASILFGGASDVVRVGMNIMYTLYNRGYSRSQEYEADSYGVRIMRNAGYNPEGAVSALAKLGMGRTTGVNRYFATHPDVPDRINRVAEIAGVSPARAQELVNQAVG